MRKILLASLVIGFLAVQAVVADTISMGGYGPYHTGRGGEFTFVTDSTSSWILGNGYVDDNTKNVAGYANTFQTFCVESGEYIYQYTTYTFGVSQGSLNTGEALTQGAAYLYHQFQIGQLTGYDYTRNQNNGNETQQLQDAIWYFMGVGVDPNNQFSILGSLNGGFAVNDLGNGSLAYQVAVLNLWNPDKSAAQDMLVCVPDGGFTLALLGMALGGIGLVSRRIRR